MLNVKARIRAGIKSQDDGIKDLRTSGGAGVKTVSQGIEDLNTTIRREKRMLRTGKS
jgi:hypothetical protein